MEQFAKELSRISLEYFVQTPNFWFPIEPHYMTPFFHWFPKPTRIWLISHFQLGHWRKAKSTPEAVRIIENGAHLLNFDMFKSLFYEADIKKEKFVFLTKSFIAIKTID